jgi:hypothetical protein
MNSIFSEEIFLKIDIFSTKILSACDLNKVQLLTSVNKNVRQWGVEYIIAIFDMCFQQFDHFATFSS